MEKGLILAIDWDGDHLYFAPSIKDFVSVDSPLAGEQCTEEDMKLAQEMARPWDWKQLPEFVKDKVMVKS